LAFAAFLVWRLRTGACGVGACGFWRYRMPPVLFDMLASDPGPSQHRLQRPTIVPRNTVLRRNYFSAKTKSFYRRSKAFYRVQRKLLPSHGKSKQDNNARLVEADQTVLRDSETR